MSKRPFRVGRSRTGLGLFATRPIRKRAIIAEYKGRLLTTKKADVLERKGNLYLYEINSRWTVDGTPRSNIARYANHSCNPNADTRSVKRRVFIFALRNIKPDSPSRLWRATSTDPSYSVRWVSSARRWRRPSPSRASNSQTSCAACCEATD